MRILFDQGTPAPLRDSLPGHTVATAYDAVRPEGIGVMLVTAGVAQVFAADLAETTLQLAAVERRVFAHGSGGEHEFVAEGGRDGAAAFRECLQMGLGRFLKPENGFAPVAFMCVAAG